MIQARITKNRMAELSKQFRRKSQAAILKSAQDAAVIARQLVPVASGSLRDSIAVSKTAQGTIRVTAGNDEVGYAPYVEYGTAFSEAQPFLTPAVDAVKPDLRRKLRRLLK